MGQERDMSQNTSKKQAVTERDADTNLWLSFTHTGSTKPCYALSCSAFWTKCSGIYVRRLELWKLRGCNSYANIFHSLAVFTLHAAAVSSVSQYKSSVHRGSCKSLVTIASSYLKEQFWLLLPCCKLEEILYSFSQPKSTSQYQIHMCLFIYLFLHSFLLWRRKGGEINLKSSLIRQKYSLGGNAFPFFLFSFTPASCHTMPAASALPDPATVTSGRLISFPFFSISFLADH